LTVFQQDVEALSSGGQVGSDRPAGATSCRPAKGNSSRQPGLRSPSAPQKKRSPACICRRIWVIWRGTSQVGSDPCEGVVVYEGCVSNGVVALGYSLAGCSPGR
jgi:hypothetical protein